MWKKLGREAKRIGKQAEAIVQEAREEVKEVVNPIILEVATSGQLKQATDRANNVKEKLDAITTKILAANNKSLALQASPEFRSAYSKDDLKAIFSKLATKYIALGEVSKQVAAKQTQIEQRPDNGTSSRSSARDDCEKYLGEQIDLEKTFSAQLAELNIELEGALEAISDVETKIQANKEAALRAEAIANLVQQAQISRGLWDELLNRPLFPATLDKNALSAKLTDIDVGINSLIGGEPEPTLEAVSGLLTLSTKAREQLVRQVDAAAAQQQQYADLEESISIANGSVVAFSNHATAAITGAGNLPKAKSNNPFDNVVLPTTVRAAPNPFD